MDRVLLFLSVLGACVILCQWYMVVRLRKYLLGKDREMRRLWCYSILIILGLINLVGLHLSVSSPLLPVDSDGRKVAAVVMFSYYGCTLVLCVFFLALGVLVKGLQLMQPIAVFVRKVCVNFPLPKLDQSGFVRTRDLTSGIEEPKDSGQKENAPVVVNPTDLVSPKGSSRSGNEERKEPMNPPRRVFLQWAAGAAVAGTVGLALKGIGEGFGTPLFREFEIFHPALDGLDRPLTFLQVSDFHYGFFFGSKELDELIGLLNSLNGDALCLTGDVFHSPMSPVERAVPILKKLKPRIVGNFVIMGNHEFYTGEHRTVQAFKDSGLRILRNEWLTFERGDTCIQLGGVDDPMTNWLWGKEFPLFRDFVKNAPRSPGFKILLSHRPNVLPFAAEARFDVVLAGHTHGGQIILPVPTMDRGMSLAGLVSAYTRGWYHMGPTRMYLSSGVGLTFVPWRINCPPEIAVFHLTPSRAGNKRVWQIQSR